MKRSADRRGTEMMTSDSSTASYVTMRDIKQLGNE